MKELRNFPSDSIDMVITSPPYYGLRKYATEPSIWGGNEFCEHSWIYGDKKGISGGTKSKKVHIHGKENFQIVPDSKYGNCEKCGAWLGELGCEPTPFSYIDHLILVCDELNRILKPTGSLWWNIDDSRSGSNQGAGSDKSKVKQGTVKDGGAGTLGLLSNLDIAKKSLIGIPDRFKISMIDRGWVCRNEIIWHKPNQMPEPTKDRFTDDFEKLFFFTKNGKYYFEQQFEPYTKPLNRWGGENAKSESDWDRNVGRITHRERQERPNTKGKNKRTVWSINTKGYRSAHVAVFPETLIETPVIAGCPKKGIVLDPFFGSGTTGVVAKRFNRNFIGIELNEEYIKIAEKRLKENE